MADTHGPVICVVDTAIEAAAFAPGTIIESMDFGCDRPPAGQPRAAMHGNLVAATALSECPGARLVAVRLMDAAGWVQQEERLEAAFEWIARHADDLGITVICAALADMSHLRSDAPFRDSGLCRVIAELRLRGIATVMPAGNWQARFHAANPEGMAWPAILREVVSVGALDPDAESPEPHRYSQRLRRRPDTGCGTTVFARPGLPGDTSGASAVVAGRIAAIRHSAPSATVAEMLSRLTSGADAVMEGIPALPSR